MVIVNGKLHDKEENNSWTPACTNEQPVGYEDNISTKPAIKAESWNPLHVYKDINRIAITMREYVYRRHKHKENLRIQ